MSHLCHLALCPRGVAATLFTLGTAPRMLMERHLPCKALGNVTFLYPQKFLKRQNRNGSDGLAVHEPQLG